MVTMKPKLMRKEMPILMHLRLGLMMQKVIAIPKLMRKEKEI